MLNQFGIFYCTIMVKMKKYAKVKMFRTQNATIGATAKLSSLAQVEWKEVKHTYFFTFVGCKGDWPFLRAAYNLNCGYNCNRKCHRCDVPDPWLDYCMLYRTMIDLYIAALARQKTPSIYDPMNEYFDF